MNRTKKDIIDEVGDELGLKISRVNPKKSEWDAILSKVRTLKDEKRLLEDYAEI